MMVYLTTKKPLQMKNLYSLATTIALFLSLFSFAQNESFSKRVINGSYSLNSAWEITYGPNDSLWVTENKSYLVSRINIANGSKTVLLNLLGTGGDYSINFAQTSTSANKKNRVAKKGSASSMASGGIDGYGLTSRFILNRCCCAKCQSMGIYSLCVLLL